MSKLNADWHRSHPMPKPATLETRWQWHQEHAKHCACRPIPTKLKQALRQDKFISAVRGKGR